MYDACRLDGVVGKFVDTLRIKFSGVDVFCVEYEIFFAVL